MEIRPIGPLMGLLTSNQDLQREIDESKAQIQVTSGPERLYDQLNLELEEEEKKIRAAHPELNPLNPSDAQKLDALLAANPEAQYCQRAMEEMRNLYPSECSGWGTPWYFSNAVPE